MAKQNDSTSAMTHISKFTIGYSVTRNPKIGAKKNYSKLLPKRLKFG